MLCGLVFKKDMCCMHYSKNNLNLRIKTEPTMYAAVTGFCARSKCLQMANAIYIKIKNTCFPPILTPTPSTSGARVCNVYVLYIVHCTVPLDLLPAAVTGSVLMRRLFLVQHHYPYILRAVWCSIKTVPTHRYTQYTVYCVYLLYSGPVQNSAPFCFCKIKRWLICCHGPLLR